jgi:hypothetical protein
MAIEVATTISRIRRKVRAKRTDRNQLSVILSRSQLARLNGILSIEGLVSGKMAGLTNAICMGIET